MHGTIVMSVTCIEHDGNIIHKSGNEDIRSTTCANDGYHAGVCEKQVNNERIAKSVKSPFNGFKVDMVWSDPKNCCIHALSIDIYC